MAAGYGDYVSAVRVCVRRSETPDRKFFRQGSQFTSDKYIAFIRDNGIRQSMDGKSRWADNIMIERWFRSFKYEEAYLTEYANLKEARETIGRYIYNYNFERCHQAIDNKRPAEMYYPAMLLDEARAAA